MAALTASVTTNYLGYLAQRFFLDEEGRTQKLGKTHERAARRITAQLAGLRGPAMKLGQSLSLQTGFLPEEMLKELATLQMGAPPMHPSLVRAQIAASLGKRPEDAFRHFEPQPFAAASLGQVHHAVTHASHRVVVKVQYPNIREAIAGDFRWFRTLSLGAQLSRVLPPVMIDELEEQITAETDYHREARNLDLFGSALQPLGYVEVPTPVPALSADRVLTMSHVPGEHLERYLASRPSQKERDLLGERLLELFYFQVLQLGVFHSDPHWGNYLFSPSATIGLVDFGSVKTLAPVFVQNLRSVFLYAGDRDAAAFTDLMAERYALYGIKLTRQTRAALSRFSKEFYGSVYPPDESLDHVAVDFGDPAIMRSYMKLSGELLLAKASLPEYLMLARSETGLYQTLHRLKSRVRTSMIVRKHLRGTGPSTAANPSRVARA